MQDGRAGGLRRSGVDAAMVVLAVRARLDLPFAPAPTLPLDPADDVWGPPFDDIDAWLTTGADVAMRLLDAIEPDEPLTVIGGDAEGIAELQRRYSLKDVRWHRAPARLKHNPEAILAAAEFAVAQDSRFVFICVGVAQRKILARAVAHCSKGRGAGLCVGVSLDEICGRDEPAPAWMADLGLAWLHRLLREPRR